MKGESRKRERGQIIDNFMYKPVTVLSVKKTQNLQKARINC